MPAGWPEGPTPVVDEVQVAGITFEGRQVALVRFVDQMGNALDVHVSERAAWLAVVGCIHFLRQSHTGQHCRGCGLTPDEHPNAKCTTWH